MNEMLCPNDSRRIYFILVIINDYESVIAYYLGRGGIKHYVIYMFINRLVSHLVV